MASFQRLIPLYITGIGIPVRWEYEYEYEYEYVQYDL